MLKFTKSDTSPVEGDATSGVIWVKIFRSRVLENTIKYAKFWFDGLRNF